MHIAQLRGLLRKGNSIIMILYLIDGLYSISFPLDSVVNDAQPSEMDGLNGTRSNADFEDLICTIEHIFSISWPCFASRLVWFHFPDL